MAIRNSINSELPIPISDGGTGKTTAQEAIDALTNVASATVGHALVKTASGSVGFEPVGGGSTFPLPNNTFATWRNAADTANINVLKVDPNDDTTIRADVGKRLNLNANGTGAWFVDAIGTNIILGNQGPGDALIKNDTVDGLDDKILAIAAGGDALDTRGPFIKMWGNEHTAVNNSMLLLSAGNKITGNGSNNGIRLYTPSTNTIQFYTNATYRWEFNANGHLVPEGAATETLDLGSSTRSVRNLYVKEIPTGFRIPNNISIKWRNSSNTADLNILTVDNNDTTKLTSNLKTSPVSLVPGNAGGSFSVTLETISTPDDTLILSHDGDGLTTWLRNNSSSNVGRFQISSTSTIDYNNGSYIELYANNWSGTIGGPDDGLVRIVAGLDNGSNDAGKIQLKVTAAKPLELFTNNTLRWLIDSNGNFVPQGTTGTLNLGSSSQHIQTIYVDNIVGYSPFPMDNSVWATWKNALNTANINVLRVDSNDDTILQADSGNAIGFNPNASPGFFMADVSGDMTLGNSNASSNAFVIRNNTSDGSDNKNLQLTAGGSFGETRGGSISLFGNESTGGVGGMIRFIAGQTSTGHIELKTTDPNTEIRFYNNNTLKWLINSSGHITPNGNKTQDIGNSSNHIRDLYVEQIILNGLDGEWRIQDIAVNNASQWIKNSSVDVTMRVNNTGSGGVFFEVGSTPINVPFTGYHRYVKKATETINEGDAVTIDSNGELVRITSANAKDCVGIASSYNVAIEAEFENDSLGVSHPQGTIFYHVAGVGDSRARGLQGLNVCDQAGNISKGDLLCTSDVPGHLMKQADDIIRSTTVAKCMEDVDFVALGTSTKTGVYGFIYCG